MMKIKIHKEKYFAYVKWIARDVGAFIPGIVWILVLEACASLAGVAMAAASKNMVDFAVSKNLPFLMIAAGVFAICIAASIGLRAGSSMLSVQVQEAYANYLRQRAFSRIFSLDWLAVSKYHSGDLLTRLTSDINSVSGLAAGVLPDIVSLGVQMTAAFFLLLHYEPSLAVFAFVLGPTTVFFSRVWGRKLKSVQVKVQESESTYRSYIQEAIQQMMIIKTFCLENGSLENIRNMHRQRMVWITRKNRTSLAASTLLSLGYWVGYFFAFGWGALRLMQNTGTFGTLTAFLQLVGQVQGPFIGLTRTLPQVISAAASMDRLMEIEGIQTEKSVDAAPIPGSAEICLRDVSFEYLPGKPVLCNASAVFRKGEITALVGPSGEGKTTVVRLLFALLSPFKGQVVFKQGGREYPASPATRGWIAYVPQGNTLFSGTLADNLRLGALSYSEGELQAAAKAACAWEFIEKLPEGLHTVIGEKGIGLSEGQAQRIAIARALLRKAPILILDEATSALDADTELRVLQNIKSMKPSRTCIVITHRSSALRFCAKTYRLSKGKLVQYTMKKPKQTSELPEERAEQAFKAVL